MKYEVMQMYGKVSGYVPECIYETDDIITAINYIKDTLFEDFEYIKQNEEEFSASATPAYMIRVIKE